MKYTALLTPVVGRGVPPTAFLDELVAWGKSAPADIFAPNDEPGDVMTKLLGLLGPWQGFPGSELRALHRRCCMLELLRCLGGFESSWRWNCGVDRTNKTSMAHKEGQETGAFQVSYDSLWLEKNHHTLRDFLARENVVGIDAFIATMKVDHVFALEYAARLLRVSYQWDGPIKRHEIDSSLKREAVAEFMRLLA